MIRKLEWMQQDYICIRDQWYFAMQDHNCFDMYMYKQRKRISASFCQSLNSPATHFHFWSKALQLNLLALFHFPVILMTFSLVLLEPDKWSSNPRHCNPQSLFFQPLNCLLQIVEITYRNCTLVKIPMTSHMWKELTHIVTFSLDFIGSAFPIYMLPTLPVFH